MDLISDVGGVNEIFLFLGSLLACGLAKKLM